MGCTLPLLDGVGRARLDRGGGGPWFFGAHEVRILDGPRWFSGDILSSTPVRRLPVSIMDLRELRLLVERSSRAIHSNANMVRQDKVIVLSHLAKAKRLIDSALQLELFSDDQLLG